MDGMDRVPAPAGRPGRLAARTEEGGELAALAGKGGELAALAGEDGELAALAGEDDKLAALAGEDGKLAALAGEADGSTARTGEGGQDAGAAAGGGTARLLEKLRSAAGQAADAVLRALADEAQFRRYLVERREKYAAPSGGTGRTGEAGAAGPEAGRTVLERRWEEEQVFQKVDLRAVRELAACLKELTALARALDGPPEGGPASQAEDGALRVILEGELADWAG